MSCVSNAIIRQLEEPYASYDWDIEVFEDDNINAFAMPGGYIGVHSGLILAAMSESELAAVLAHEVSHVTQRHMARIAVGDLWPDEIVIFDVDVETACRQHMTSERGCRRLAIGAGDAHHLVRRQRRPRLCK